MARANMGARANMRRRVLSPQGVVAAGSVHRQHERKMSPDTLAVVRPRGVPERLAVDQRRPNPEFVLGL